MNDFTENAYLSLLKKAKDRFKFIETVTIASKENEVLWRHDIDVSPYQAQKIAQMEADIGVHAFYFVLLSGSFYNVFEPHVLESLREIKKLGHTLGLHFDPNSAGSTDHASRNRELRFQAQVLGELLGSEISCFSVHNPTVGSGEDMINETVEGMVNFSAPSLRERFWYCSDSNGVWRFRSLWEVIEDESITRLYALTHPCWWTEKPSSPREKILAQIESRAIESIYNYDKLLDLHRRPNERK